MPASVCKKVPQVKCLRMSKCMYTNGSKRKYCRLTGKKTCRGKSASDCKSLPKCLYTKKGDVKSHCKKRTTMKKR